MLFVYLRDFEFHRLQITVGAGKLQSRVLKFARQEPGRAQMAGRSRIAALHVVVGQDLDMRPPAVAFLGKIGCGEIGRRQQCRNGGKQEKRTHIQS